MNPLHFWQKRPIYESRFGYYVRLPIVHWLWRRGILHSDGPHQRKGPFYITWNTQPKNAIRSGFMHTYMDWERTQSEEFQRAAQQRRRAVYRHPTQRQVNAASAMMRAHDEQARAARLADLPMHMDT